MTHRWRLARLRARGQLAEVRAAELRFTPGEAAALLEQVAAGSGLPLPDAAVAALAERTEGWAAGLQLAGLSLRGQDDIAGFVAAFTGSHRYVLDYLAGEVLERQSEQVRMFLLETSVLERLSGPLCDAVTGRGGSQALLEQVELAGLFLMPLDEVRGWWRYHHLFADLLRARLRAEQPGQVTALHRNAAAWCEEHGLAGDAVRHALEAGDAAWAARLIERHAEEQLFHGQGTTVQRWLAALPAGLAGSRPRLLLARARLAVLGGQVEEAGDLVDAAERAQAGAHGGADEPYRPSAGRGASVLANVPATIALYRAYLADLRGDAEQAIAHASRALAEADEDEWMLASQARACLGLAEWMRGRPEEAEHLLSSAIPHWRAAGEYGLVIQACHHLGQVQRAQGRLDAALETYRQAVEIAATPGRQHLPTAGAGHVGAAEVAYQRGDLDDALRHVADGIPLARNLAYTQPLASGLATLAWIRQTSGDPAGALKAIGEAGQAAPGPPGLLNPVPAQRARLLLAQGNLPAAAGFVQQYGLGADDEPDYPREPGQLVLARVLLAQDRPGLALALLDRLHAAALAQDRIGSVIEIGALRTLALAASGDEAGAVTSPGRDAPAGLPAGLRAGLRRRGPADGRAARPARRGPARRPGGRWRPARLPGRAAAGLRRRASRARIRPGHRRGARHRRSADQPRAGGASDAGGGPVESGHRRRARGQPGHGQEARGPFAG